MIDFFWVKTNLCRLQVQEEGQVRIVLEPRDAAREGRPGLPAERSRSGRPQRSRTRHILPTLSPVRRHVCSRGRRIVQDRQLFRLSDGQHVDHGVSNQPRRVAGRRALLHAQGQSISLQVCPNICLFVCAVRCWGFVNINYSVIKSAVLFLNVRPPYVSCI